MFVVIAAIAVACLAMIVLILWIGRKPEKPGPTFRKPADQLLVRPKLPEPEELFPTEYDSEGEPINVRDGPSPELLARMNAAGMNTTHSRWEDSPAARRKRETRNARPFQDMGEGD